MYAKRVPLMEDEMKFLLRQILCKHDYEIRRWHWCHGINGDEPRMIEAEVICQKCEKVDYFYPKRGSTVEKTIIERNGTKQWPNFKGNKQE